MKYLVFLIYILVLVEFMNSRIKKTDSTYPHGHEYYKNVGMLNTILGFIGIIVTNIFLSEKGIIPELFVRFALGGFFLVSMFGLYCIIKMMMTLEP